MKQKKKNVRWNNELLTTFEIRRRNMLVVTTRQYICVDYKEGKEEEWKSDDENDNVVHIWRQK